MTLTSRIADYIVMLIAVGLGGGSLILICCADRPVLVLMLVPWRGLLKAG